MGFPCGSAGKESARNARDLGSIPGLGRSRGEGKGYPLQYSCCRKRDPFQGLKLGSSLRNELGSDRTERLHLHFSLSCWRRKWQPTPVFLPGESQGFNFQVFNFRLFSYIINSLRTGAMSSLLKNFKHYPVSVIEWLLSKYL